MIVVDTSALIAIVQAEPEAEDFSRVLGMNNVCLPASALVEANILAIRRGLISDLKRLLADLHPETIVLDESLSLLAIDAFRRYGKGRHKASLNFGDCLVYATAKYLKVPLLYKGDDFIHTDLTAAI